MRRELVPPTYLAKACPRLSEMAIPHIRLIVTLGCVSFSHEQFLFNGHTKPFTTLASDYRVLGEN